MSNDDRVWDNDIYSVDEGELPGMWESADFMDSRADFIISNNIVDQQLELFNKNAEKFNAEDERNRLIEEIARLNTQLSELKSAISVMARDMFRLAGDNAG